jgi:hypothetical protein
VQLTQLLQELQLVQYGSRQAQRMLLLLCCELSYQLSCTSSAPAVYQPSYSNHFFVMCEMSENVIVVIILQAG